VSTKLEQLKATFQYNLSKRTAVYTTASLLKNKDATRYTLPGASPTGPRQRWRRHARYRIRSAPLLLIEASSASNVKAFERPPSGGLFLPCSRRSLRAASGYPL
jgi:hypothetical protein